MWNQSFTWNALGQLVQVVTNATTTSFGYDGWGRRVRKTVGTTRTDYVVDGDHLIAEVDGSGNLLRSYAYYPGVDRPHSVQVGTQLYHYVTELPGHVTGLVNSSNQLVNQYEYAAYGEPITAQEQVTQPFRFGGREYDAEMKLYFHRARYYDPHLGRFISEDPISLEGGINLYAYTASDPVNRRDPSGLDYYEVTCTKEWVEVQVQTETHKFLAIVCDSKRVSGAPSAGVYLGCRSLTGNVAGAGGHCGLRIVRPNGTMLSTELYNAPGAELSQFLATAGLLDNENLFVWVRIGGAGAIHAAEAALWAVRQEFTQAQPRYNFLLRNSNMYIARIVEQAGLEIGWHHYNIVRAGAFGLYGLCAPGPADPLLYQGATCR